MYIVTGMHRCGTSMISNLLQELGIPFGAASGFYAADEWNEKGYFERSDVMDLNSELITGFRRNEGKLERLLCSLRYTSFPDPVRRAARMERHREAAVAIANDMKGAAIKDPRFCITLDFWRRHTEIEGYVVCLRHPLSVAQSLRRRQRYPRFLGLRFWNYHMENLLRFLPEEGVLFVDFDVMSSEGFGVELEKIRGYFALDIELGEMEERYRRIFSPRLRHHEADEKAALPEKTRALWQELQRRYQLGASQPQGS